VELIRARLGGLVGRDKVVATQSVLFELAFDRIAQRVSREDVTGALGQANISLLAPEDAVRDRITALRAVFTGELDALAIPDVEITRPETTALIDAIAAGQPMVLLTGDAGIGKSH